MSTTVTWSPTSSVVHSILGAGTAPTLKNLASTGQKLGAEYDNASNKYRYAAFRLLCRAAGGGSFAVNSAVDLYIMTALDGSGYQDGDDSIVPPLSSRVRNFPLRAVNGQQTIDVVNILVPPFKFKPLIINNGGAAFTNTDNENLLDMYLYNELLT